jgi:hypothetical protein
MKSLKEPGHLLLISQMKIWQRQQTGVVSGPMGLTPLPAEKVKAPIIAEAPVHIECSVKQIMELGSHHMFIAEVVNVMVDDRFIDPDTGAFDMKKANLIAYMHGNYYKIGELIGKFGWSVEKPKTKQKRIDQSKS